MMFQWYYHFNSPQKWSCGTLFFSEGISQKVLYLGGSNLNGDIVWLLLSHIKYEINIIYLTIYSLLDIRSAIPEELL